MITRLSEHCRACVCLIALMVLPSAVIGTAYLPLVGPSPLRFEIVKARAKNYSWTAPTVPIPPAITFETNPPPVNSTIAASNIAPSTLANAQVTASSPPLPENLSTNSATQTRPANDLLVVTPDMLVDYFKPNAAATNAANVRVLVPVNFTPPASASVPSSQAIYNSQ